MKPNDFYNTQSKERIKQVCTDAGTTVANFQQIALFNGSVSKRLAKRLADASNHDMTVLEILFPDSHIDKAS